MKNYIKYILAILFFVPPAFADGTLTSGIRGAVTASPRGRAVDVEYYDEVAEGLSTIVINRRTETSSADQLDTEIARITDEMAALQAELDEVNAIRAECVALMLCRP